MRLKSLKAAFGVGSASPVYRSYKSTPHTLTQLSRARARVYNKGILFNAVSNTCRNTTQPATPLRLVFLSRFSVANPRAWGGGHAHGLFSQDGRTRKGLAFAHSFLLVPISLSLSTTYVTSPPMFSRVKSLSVELCVSRLLIYKYINFL